MEEKKWYTVEEVVEALCKDSPSFKIALEEAKKELDNMSKEEKNELIDNVFRRVT